MPPSPVTGFRAAHNRTRRQRIALPFVLFALASLWVQWAWHKPMQLANATAVTASGVTVACGPALNARDIATLVAQGLLDASAVADNNNGGHATLSLCDLLTAPPASAPDNLVAHIGTPPAVSPGIFTYASVFPATPGTRLPPACGPPPA